LPLHCNCNINSDSPRCVECVPFALLLNHAFPYHDFMTNTGDKNAADSMRTVRAPKLNIVTSCIHGRISSRVAYTCVAVQVGKSKM
jgi:hypothetical protein